MFSIKKEIQKVLHKNGLTEQLEAFLVCREAQRIISRSYSNKRYHPKVRKYLKYTHTLEIELPHILIGQKLRSRQGKVIREINNKMKGEYIKKVRYCIK